MIRYIVGASFMGMGGMLAGGCAVGAGLTGGSAFSITAWIALASMWAGAALTDALVDRQWKTSKEEAKVLVIPALTRAANYLAKAISSKKARFKSG